MEETHHPAPATGQTLMVVKVQHIDKACGTKAMPILVESWSYLLNNKLCPTNQWPLAWDMEAMIAVEGSAVVGVIGYTHSVWTRELVLNIGYVRPAWRRRGVYTKLWKALVAHAKKNKIPTISSGTAVSNKAVRDFCYARGRKETRVQIDYAVPGVPQP